MLKNWKTTLAGVGMLVGLAAQTYVTQSKGGKVDPTTAFAGISAAIGLIFAKDHTT